MFWKKHKLLMVWFLVLAVPFLSALMLAISVTADHGSRRLQPSLGTALSNFRAVLVGGDIAYEFAFSFATSALLCVAAALITVPIALPVARTLGTKWRRYLWMAAGVTIGARVVPITAPIPIFEQLGRHLLIPNSLMFVIALYTLLSFPLACALMAAAPWQQIELNMKLLALDAPLNAVGVVTLVFRGLGPDLRITGGAVFLLAWSDFVIASFFLPTGHSTISRLLANKQSFLGTQWGQLGAAIIISAIPVLVAVWIISKAVKGRMKLANEQS